MNIKDLQYLLALAATRHFGRAAELTFVSQPTLSTQLKKLEEELGVQLFERDNKSVMLTPIGQRIINEARQIMLRVDNIKEIARDSKDPLARSFRLGIIPTLGPYLLPRILQAIKKELPQLELIVIENKTEIILRQLREGGLDAVILALPVKIDGLVEEKLFCEPFYVALPKNHPLAKKPKLTMRDLERETILLLEEGHCLREQALEACRWAKTQASEFSATSLETLRQIVSMGAGITLLPALAVKTAKADKNIVIKSFQSAIPSREIGMLWRQSSATEICCEAVSDIIKNQIKNCPEVFIGAKINVMRELLG